MCVVLTTKSSQGFHTGVSQVHTPAQLECVSIYQPWTNSKRTQKYLGYFFTNDLKHLHAKSVNVETNDRNLQRRHTFVCKPESLTIKMPALSAITWTHADTNNSVERSRGSAGTVLAAQAQAEF